MQPQVRQLKRVTMLALLLACLTAIPGTAQARYRDGMNLYEYVKSSPLSHTDPHGLYGVDVHRSLTTYMAQHAGFNDKGAGGCGNLTPKAIGDNTQLVDDDERKPGWSINLNIHFARPKEVQSHKDKAFQSCDPRDIGTYVHSLEDTFAHQPGQSDREQYRHHLSPTKRRRWHVNQGHLPDYTWRRPDLANNMAETVYGELQALAKKCCKCPSKVDDWATIKGIVDKFNRYEPATAPWTRWGEMSESDFDDKVNILFPRPAPNPIPAENPVPYRHEGAPSMYYPPRSLTRPWQIYQQ